MFTVALLAQKGGVGKTTLALTLAVLAELEGESVGILDADPSANATDWNKARQKHQKSSPPLASVASPEKLRAAIKAARADRIEWLFIDTGAGVAELPALAAELADLVLMPCLTTANSMRGLAPTARLVRRLRKPGFFVINGGSSSKHINDACALALTSAYGLPAAATHITSRRVIGALEDTGLALPETDATDSSTKNGQAEFRALWRWLTEQKDNTNTCMNVPA